MTVLNNGTRVALKSNALTTQAVQLITILFLSQLLLSCSDGYSVQAPAPITLKNVRLPGFSMLLPEGTVIKSTKYVVAGVHKIDMTPQHSVFERIDANTTAIHQASVFWQATNSQPEDIPRYRRLFFDSVGEKPEPQNLPMQGRSLDAVTISNKTIVLAYCFLRYWI